MSDESARCPRGKAEKPQRLGDTEAKSKKWLSRKISKETNGDSMSPVNTAVHGLIERQDPSERSSALFAATAEINEGIVGPGVHRPFAKGLASILTSLTAITKFPRRQEATAASEVSTVRGTVEASTSGVQKSILREREIGENSDSSRGLKMKQFWWWYPQRKTKKSIIFVDVSSRMSDSSLDSVVTLIGAKPLKSALRSTTGSLPSGNSSVRFSLPEVLRPGEKSLTTLRIGKWDIVCDVTENESTEGWIATWRSLRRTRLCKIVVCFALGVIVPSLLVVPVLVYEDSSIVATSAG